MTQLEPRGERVDVVDAAVTGACSDGEPSVSAGTVDAGSLGCWWRGDGSARTPIPVDGSDRTMALAEGGVGRA